MGHGHGSSLEFHPPKVNPAHKKLATAVGATMWLWVFYRLKNDGKAFLGLEHPWDHHHHDHDDGHNNGHGSHH